jgi:hypothetical protein
MATTVFDNIITQGVRSGQVPARTQQARDWYRNTASGFGQVRENKLRSPDRLTGVITPGSMYMYRYDPKYKDVLPMYDKFPLMFPFRVASDRFWGINLHYLPLKKRAILMDALYDITNNKRFDETTRLRLSYGVLNKAAKFKYFKECVKQYLFSHTQGNFIYVYPSEWDIALFLPLEKFVYK